MTAKKSTEMLELAEARKQGLYNIGQAAQASGISSKMIRHYEATGLIHPANRTLANYRIYSQTDIHQLRFIKRARNLGFTIKQIEHLLQLWQNRSRHSAEVKQLALAHLHEMDERIRELQEMRDTLANLAQQCHGDQRPDCPILTSLEKAEAVGSI